MRKTPDKLKAGRRSICVTAKLGKCLRIVATSKWLDLYHIHPSLCGYPKRDVALLCAIETETRKHLAKRFAKYQSFVLIDIWNRSYDAIYCHTENANKTPFPAGFTPGVITHRIPQYRQVMAALQRLGYIAFKVKGYTNIVAVHPDCSWWLKDKKPI